MDFDFSAEGSVGGESSLWESSDRDDITGDESGDDSTQFSGSISDDNGCGDTGDEHLKTISTESTGSGTEGDNEEAIPRYELRLQKKKQCRSPAKCSRYGDTSDENDKVFAREGSLSSQHSSGYVGRGRGGGRRGCGRGGGGRGRGRGGGSPRKSSKKQSDGLPMCAIPIRITDSKYVDPDVFCPLREPGPHVPPGTQASALDLFELYLIAALWSEYCNVHMNMQNSRRKANEDGTSYL